MAAVTSSPEVDDRPRCDLEWWILGSHSDLLVVALQVFEYQIIDLLQVFLYDRAADVFRSSLGYLRGLAHGVIRYLDWN